jgi:hypothetical protein
MQYILKCDVRELVRPRPYELDSLFTDTHYRRRRRGPFLSCGRWRHGGAALLPPGARSPQRERRVEPTGRTARQHGASGGPSSKASAARGGRGAITIARGPPSGRARQGCPAALQRPRGGAIDCDRLPAAQASHPPPRWSTSGARRPRGAAVGPVQRGLAARPSPASDVGSRHRPAGGAPCRAAASSLAPALRACCCGVSSASTRACTARSASFPGSRRMTCRARRAVSL